MVTNMTKKNLKIRIAILDQFLRSKKAKPKNQKTVHSYPRTPVPPYPRTLVPPYPRTLVPLYPRTLVPAHPRTPVLPYPRTLVPPYPRTSCNERCGTRSALFSHTLFLQFSSMSAVRLNSSAREATHCAATVDIITNDVGTLLCECIGFLVAQLLLLLCHDLR